jgi:hypothetical protein
LQRNCRAGAPVSDAVLEALQTIEALLEAKPVMLPEAGF